MTEILKVGTNLILSSNEMNNSIRFTERTGDDNARWVEISDAHVVLNLPIHTDMLARILLNGDLLSLKTFLDDYKIKYVYFDPANLLPF